MGSCRFAALVVLLLVYALLPDSASARVLQGEKPSSGEGAPAPAAAATGGSEKSAASKESGQSSTATQEPQTNTQKQETQPAETATKDSPPPPPGGAEDKGQEGDAAQESSQPVPPKNVQASPPPPGSEATGGTDKEGGSSDKEKLTEEGKEALKKCVEDPAGVQCSISGELLACLLVSQTASTGSFIAIQNAGQNSITVNVKATSNISTEQQLQRLNLTKGDSKTVSIRYSNPNARTITLNVGNEQCVWRTGQQTDFSWQQSLPDWQQKFQQIAAYATNMDPIYGAYLFVFTVVLVGVVFACCKFARRRRNSGVPYQQLEMGSQAPNPSSANNTTSTADGWDDGWDDDWDDEEAPAKPSDTRPAGSVSANGLSSRSQTNSKDGWDVDWDD